jgi:hypothetical protein
VTPPETLRLKGLSVEVVELSPANIIQLANAPVELAFAVKVTVEPSL